MQRLACLRVLWLAALCACSSAHLPTVGFGLRSSWRAREQDAGRHVELLAGVFLAWSGASRSAGVRTEAIDEDPYAVAERAITYDGPVCLDALFCRWERTERENALTREGVREERRDGVSDETVERVREEILDNADSEGVPP
jgi:hypothetical protein